MGSILSVRSGACFDQTLKVSGTAPSRSSILVDGKVALIPPLSVGSAGYFGASVSVFGESITRFVTLYEAQFHAYFIF